MVSRLVSWRCASTESPAELVAVVEKPVIAVEAAVVVAMSACVSVVLHATSKTRVQTDDWWILWVKKVILFTIEMKSSLKNEKNWHNASQNRAYHQHV